MKSVFTQPKKDSSVKMEDLPLRVVQIPRVWSPVKKEWIVDEIGRSMPELYIQDTVAIYNLFPFSIRVYLKRGCEYTPFLELPEFSTYYFRPRRTRFLEDGVTLRDMDDIHSVATDDIQDMATNNWLTRPVLFRAHNSTIVFNQTNFSTRLSGTTINLIGEFTELVIKNNSGLDIDIWYYNSYLGRACSTRNYIRSSNGLAGFRLNTCLTIVFISPTSGKVIGKPFKVQLTNVKTDTIDIGLMETM